MKVLKRFKYCMTCCLEPTYLAILLLPLSSAINVSNTNNTKNQYWIWLTTAVINITSNSVVDESSYQSSTGASIASMCNAYLKLCVNHYHQRHFNNYRNVENYNNIRYHIFKNFGGLNNSKSEKYPPGHGNGNNSSWSLEQQWNRKEHTTRGSGKSKRRVNKVNSQHYCDDIFEITLCMLLAVFVEIIPLALRYVRKRTVICWRRLQLFCYCSHWSVSRTLFPRQLAASKLRKTQDHLQKLTCTNRQNQIIIFTITTRKMCALFVNGGTTPFIFLSGVPITIIVRSCRKTCQHVLLTALVKDPVTLTFITRILTRRVLYILIPRDNPLFRSHLAHPSIILLLLESTDFHYDYNSRYKCINCGASRKSTQSLSAVDASNICGIGGWQHSHQKHKIFVICQPLFDNTEIQMRNSDNNYCKIHNYHRYLKPSENNLDTLKYRNKEKAKLYLHHVTNDRNETKATFKIYKKIVTRRNITVVLQEKQTRCKLFSPNSKIDERRPNVRSSKIKAKAAKSIKSTNPAKIPAIAIMNSKSSVTPKIEKLPKSNNDEWKHCLHNIIEFNLCCSFWCIYCYWRYNCILGKNVSGCCSAGCWCWQWQCGHCLYCCFYCWCCCCYNRCYCCCYMTKLHAPSNSCQYCHLANRINNNQHYKCFIKLKRFAKAVNTIRKQNPNQNQPKHQRGSQQLESHQNFFRSDNLKNCTFFCSECFAFFACRTLYWDRNAHSLHPSKIVTTLSTTKTSAPINGEALYNKKSNLIQFASCGAKYVGKCLLHQIMHMGDYFYRYITTVLRVKISVRGSAAILIKVTREQQQQQQQQQQMLCIAYDQQLKMNNLCKIFCNNWKRHRRRRRRRRRRRIYKQEQQQQQSVALQQQHINSEKYTLLHMSNIRLHIWDLNACKTIATNVPSVRLILSKATARSLLAAMRLANTKIITLSDRNRKNHAFNPPQTPALLTSPTYTASTTGARVSRNRSRPNLVWLFIGLVWFEGPKYVNCSINGNGQPQQSNTQTQTQTSTDTSTQASLQSHPVPSHQRLQYQTQPARRVTNLLLLNPNHKSMPKVKIWHMQKTATVVAEDAKLFKSKLNQRKNSNVNGKNIRSGNCFASRRRSSKMAIITNEKHTRPYNADSITIDGKHNAWLESETEVDFLDEEAHSAHSDRFRLESIKRQILTKLGLKHKPNVSHPLPKQFVWDTIYRADGIRSIVSEFDFNENGSHQWERMTSASNKANDVTNLPAHLERSQKGEYATDKRAIVNSVNRINGNEHKKEFTFSNMLIKSAFHYKNMSNVVEIPIGKFLTNNSSSASTDLKIYTNHSVINKIPSYLNIDDNKSSNRKYKDYMQNFRFDQYSKLNNSKSTNNFTYLMHSSKHNLNKEFPEDSEAVSNNQIYDYNDGVSHLDNRKINYPDNFSKHNGDNAFFHTENVGEYNLHYHEYEMIPEPNKYESEDFFGDTQEIITFAEKGKMYKQHRLVEFSPQANDMPNQKLFVRKAEIHIRIDKTIGGTDNKNKNNFGCRGKKTKLKLWIFQLMENNTSKKGCDQPPRLCASYNVDTIHLGWQKFDVTSTIRNWHARVPMKKLRLLIDCTGCGKKYILHLFDQPLDNLQQKQPHPRHHAMNQNDLVVQWARQRSGLNNDNVLGKQNDDNRKALEKRPNTDQLSTIACNSFFRCSIKKNLTSVVDNYKSENIKTQLFQRDLLEQNTHRHRANQPQLQQQKNTKHYKQYQIKRQDAQYSQRHIHLPNSKSLEPNPNRPFLVLHTETKRLRRVRRRAIDCVGATHGQCCKESFYVSFKALGWDDWIIAPRGYFANYCRGDCTGPFRTPDTFQTFHAHFIEEYRKIGLLNGMQPCCAPVKFSSMSLIYYGDDGIIKRDLPKMVVDECGCP